jgi:hypothetical protein
VRFKGDQDRARYCDRTGRDAGDVRLEHGLLGEDRPERDLRACARHGSRVKQRDSQRTGDWRVAGESEEYHSKRVRRSAAAVLSDFDRECTLARVFFSMSILNNGRRWYKNYLTFLLRVSLLLDRYWGAVGGRQWGGSSPATTSIHCWPR